MYSNSFRSLRTLKGLDCRVCFVANKCLISTKTNIRIFIKSRLGFSVGFKQRGGLKYAETYKTQYEET